MHGARRISSSSPQASRLCNLTWARPGNVVPSIDNCVEQINTNGVAAAGDFSNPKGKPSKASAKSDSTKSGDEPAEKPSDPDRLVSVSGTGFVVSKSAHVVT